MEEKEKSCMDCENAIWCETWGEFKCTAKVRRIYEPENEARGCEDFKKEHHSKYFEKPKCQCETCLSRSGEEE